MAMGDKGATLDGLKASHDNLDGKITDLKSDLTDVKSDVYIQGTTTYIDSWVQGWIRNNGTIGSSTTECATGWLTFDDGDLYIVVESGYKIRVCRYTNTAGTWGTIDAFVINPHQTGTIIITADSSKFYKFDIMNTSGTTLAPSDLPTNVVWYYQKHMTDKTLSISDKIADSKTVGDMFNAVHVGRNVLDTTNMTANAFINNESGSQGTSESYALTDYIAVSEGDVVVALFDDSQVMALRYVAAYDSNKTLMASSGAANVNTYTVPTGVAYIRISANQTRLNNIHAIIVRDYTSGNYVYYEPYFSATIPNFVKDNRTSIQTILKYPLTMLPSYMLGALAYRPLGQLSKGYICLVSDDGDADLATYTIPMLQEKGDVPCTFAVMSSSTVFDTQTGIDAVVDAVTNHGCEIAQHGGTTWNQYSELGLHDFFNTEADYFTSIGLTPYGAVCPAHNISDLIRVVAGGRFGCVRTGYDDGLPRYTNYTNGARSNVFGLSSQSAVDGTLATQTATLDLCNTNHWLRIIHWHENELDTDTKAQLEGIIDYAKSIGLTFITMKDIPWIT